MSWELGTGRWVLFPYDSAMGRHGFLRTSRGSIAGTKEGKLNERALNLFFILS
jgi:hypothetical protein